VGLDPWGVASAEIVVHFIRHIFNQRVQFGREFNFYAVTSLAVEQKSAPDFRREHFFQTHCLSAELSLIAMVMLFFAAFVFNGCRQIKPVTIGQLHAIGRSGELDHITHARKPQPIGCHRHGTRGDDPVPRFGEEGIVNSLVHDPALGGQRVFPPLLFHVDERPLPAAKQEVLNAREGQKVVLGVFGHVDFTKGEYVRI